MCMNTALTLQMTMQLQQSILLKQAMPLPGQYQPYTHRMYTVKINRDIYFYFILSTTSNASFRPQQFMIQQMGQPTPTVLQQPPPFHYQIHVPSFIQLPNQRSQYQINKVKVRWTIPGRHVQLTILLYNKYSWPIAYSLITIWVV